MAHTHTHTRTHTHTYTHTHRRKRKKLQRVRSQVLKSMVLVLEELAVGAPPVVAAPSVASHATVRPSVNPGALSVPAEAAVMVSVSLMTFSYKRWSPLRNEPPTLFYQLLLNNEPLRKVATYIYSTLRFWTLI